AALRPGAGEGGDHVVGLKSLLAQHWDAHRLEHLVDQRDLHLHRVRHRAALGFVGRVDDVPKRLAGRVENAHQVAGPAVLAQEQHVAREAEQGVGRQTARAAHFRDGVEHLEKQRVGVNEEQALRGGARGHGSLAEWWAPNPSERTDAVPGASQEYLRRTTPAERRTATVSSVTAGMSCDPTGRGLGGGWTATRL